MTPTDFYPELFIVSFNYWCSFYPPIRQPGILVSRFVICQNTFTHVSVCMTISSSICTQTCGKGYRVNVFIGIQFIGLMMLFLLLVHMIRHLFLNNNLHVLPSRIFVGTMCLIKIITHSTPKHFSPIQFFHLGMSSSWGLEKRIDDPPANTSSINSSMSIPTYILY